MATEETSDKLLVHGYIRQHSVWQIPIPLINLCITFCSNLFLWTVYQQQLNKIKRGHYLQDIEIQVQDKIKLHCKLFPNGFISKDYLEKEFIQHRNCAILSLELNKLPENIKYFYIYYELRCKETNTIWKGVADFASINDAASWNERTLSTRELYKHKKLSITYAMDILMIKYKNDTDFSMDTIMQKYCDFEWNLSEKLLNAIDPFNENKINIKTRYYSPNFNNNHWCIYIKRNHRGWRSRADDWNIGVCLLRLPPKIKKIGVIMKVFVDGKGCIYNWDNQVQNFSIENVGYNSYATHETDGIEDTFWNKKPMRLKLKIEIKIRSVFIENQDKYSRLPVAYWKDFGIIEK